MVNWTFLVSTLSSKNCLEIRKYSPLIKVAVTTNHYILILGDFEIGNHEGHEQKMQIEKIITHGLYDSSNYDYDIALIKLIFI